ncbi:sensor domain-containing diguanylate cyclase [Colwellia sp. BRX10-3]|uniref:GGDEF domain-containing protein n=1 Tax=Colwellia sp. BRX10-3 TaxID=2759844 RepID=UPI0015F40DC8|nr:sensor domain-containing diguanylate cyclase [Colwellia sp. BRX10-3]MBA6392166.1 sensor domain-containing diguanylate cyclase [Colwellia sp. BRX10-3]
MTISTGNKIGLLGFLLILGIWAYVVCQIMGTFDQRSIKDKKYHVRSLNIANELRQSSDDLTRMARTFVVTGDEIYAQYYFEIIAIRNGISPRPKKYPPTYWYTDFASDRSDLTSLGKSIPLQTLMREMGFTPSELLLLQQSQDRSDSLMKIEKQAFAVMKGLYADGEGKYTIKGQSDRELAIQLLFSPRYNEAKIEIMTPIQEFIEAVENRLIHESDVFQTKQQQYLWYAILLLLISTFLALIAAIYVRNKIVLPILLLNKEAHIITKGNYKARSKVDVKNEIGSLSQSLNEMANHIEQDIDKFKQLAATDELVGISNRRAFIKSLELELERAHRYQLPLSLLMLDVDNFKVFNDTYGHCIGDEVLKTICKVSQLALRENDLMGRIGGEEFAFVLPASNIDSALIVAERIRAAVDSSSLIVGPNKVKITVSIGATQLTKTDDVRVFLNRADMAMYKAKENGRNQTYWV